MSSQPLLARRRDRLADLAELREAGRNDHRLAFPRHPGDQRQVDHLERGDLVGGRIEAREQVDGRLVERRRQDRDALLAGSREERLVPFERGVRFAIEVVELPPGPGAALDHEAGPVMVDRQRVRRVGLQLDGVGAGLRRRVDHRQRAVEAAVVVAGQFADDIGRLVGPDAAAVYRDIPHLVPLPLLRELRASSVPPIEDELPSLSPEHKTALLENPRRGDILTMDVRE